jgi:hypothetical protein
MYELISFSRSLCSSLCSLTHSSNNHQVATNFFHARPGGDCVLSVQSVSVFYFFYFLLLLLFILFYFIVAFCALPSFPLSFTHSPPYRENIIVVLHEMLKDTGGLGNVHEIRVWFVDKNRPKDIGDVMCRGFVDAAMRSQNSMG